MKINRFIVILILFSFISIYGQELVYNPINPSFVGGDTFNGSWLLSSAQAQNNISESTTSRGYSSDPLDDFTSSLNRSILSQLSKKIISDSFGEENIEEGKYEFGDFIIEVNNGNDGINITVTDDATGGETEIIIPYF